MRKEKGRGRKETKRGNKNIRTKPANGKRQEGKRGKTGTRRKERIKR